MASSVNLIWHKLEMEARQRQQAARIYRALGNSSLGVRAGYVPSTKTLELLVEVPEGWDIRGVIPQWAGMGHEVLTLALSPRPEACQLRLYLTSPEHREVFAALCDDLTDSLEDISEIRRRAREVNACLLRWRRFFDHAGTDGLSIEMQQGLFAELLWLAHMLETGLDAVEVVSAWKGCERDYHDFDWRGHVVEVKSTRGKEPHGVTVNNERQLDDRGLQSLHVYAVILGRTEGGGTTLPDSVRRICGQLGASPVALGSFRHSMTSAGYRDDDAAKYPTRWIVEGERLYHVTEGFPRIIDLPPGVGDIRYRVLLGACEQHRIELDRHLAELQRQVA